MPQVRPRIRRIEFSNFKAFKDYSVSLTDMNILVGPNNSGKSTIIGALRTLDAALRFARARAPMLTASRIFAGGFANGHSRNIGNGKLLISLCFCWGQRCET
jgi:predicted ATPase